MDPFVECFVRSEQVEHSRTFVRGLLSDLEHKNVESIAYRFGQGRMPLQWFIGVSDWDYEPLRDELVRQVGQTLGEDGGVLVFDHHLAYKNANAWQYWVAQKRQLLPKAWPASGDRRRTSASALSPVAASTTP